MHLWICYFASVISQSNFWSKVTYSQVHGSTQCSVQSSFIPKFLVGFCGKIRRPLTVLKKIQSVGGPKLSEEKKLVFHWKKNSYFALTYFFALVLTFISSLHSRDYLKKTSIKLNVATDEGSGRNEIEHWTNDKIGVAAQSWLWVWVELMAW